MKLFGYPVVEKSLNMPPIEDVLVFESYKVGDIFTIRLEGKSMGQYRVTECDGETMKLKRVEPEA